MENLEFNCIICKCDHPKGWQSLEWVDGLFVCQDCLNGIAIDMRVGHGQIRIGREIDPDTIELACYYEAKVRLLAAAIADTWTDEVRQRICAYPELSVLTTQVDDNGLLFVSSYLTELDISHGVIIPKGGWRTKQKNKQFLSLLTNTNQSNEPN